MKTPALGWQLVLAFVLSLLVLVGLIGWLQNVHILTANGMYKAIQAEPWIADPATARLDPSNYLYFPLYGALCRLLDALGIQRGVPWKQLAYLNAFWASLCIVFVYGFVHRVTQSAGAAVLAAIDVEPIRAARTPPIVPACGGGLGGIGLGGAGADDRGRRGGARRQDLRRLGGSRGAHSGRGRHGRARGYLPRRGRRARRARGEPHL
jgi:hypothetical protein